MWTFRKVLAVIVIIISALLILVNLAGLMGVWWTEATVMGIISDAVTLTDTIFQRTQVGVDRLNTRLGDVQTGVRNVETELRQVGDKVTETNLVLATLQAATERDITPAVDRLQAATENLNETLDNLDRTLRLLDRMTRGDNSVNNTVSNLRTVLAFVQDVQQDVQDLRQALQNKKQEAVSDTVDRVTRPIQRLDDRLGVAQGRLTTASTNIADGRERLARLHSNINLALFLLALALTFVILWGILALLALILYAVAFLRGHDPIARWYTAQTAPVA